MESEGSLPMIDTIQLLSYHIQNSPSRPSWENNTVPNPPSLSTPQVEDKFSLAHPYAEPKLTGTYRKEDAVWSLLWQNSGLLERGQNDFTLSGSLNPTQEDFALLLEQLETKGLSGQVDLSQVAGDFSSVAAGVNAGNLGQSIDYLTSRYVALVGQLQRNGASQETQEELEQVFAQGKEALVSSYADRLQDALGLSDQDAQQVRASLEGLIDRQVQTYSATQAQRPLPQAGTADAWLANMDEYIAGQLRQAAGTLSEDASDGAYSLGDLCKAGEIAGAYQEIVQQASTGAGTNEAKLALDLSMVDMQTEILCQGGRVSDAMSALLQGSRDQRHEAVFDAADQCFAVRRERALSGTGPIPDLDRDLLRSIYGTVLTAFRANGGDALSAIRAGVTFGREATKSVHQQAPAVSRWGNAMAAYWKSFYSDQTRSDWQGGTQLRPSEYAQYADIWQNFFPTAGAACAMPSTLLLDTFA